MPFKMPLASVGLSENKVRVKSARCKQVFKIPYMLHGTPDINVWMTEASPHHYP